MKVNLYSHSLILSLGKIMELSIQASFGKAGMYIAYKGLTCCLWAPCLHVISPAVLADGVFGLSLSLSPAASASCLCPCQ